MKKLIAIVLVLSMVLVGCTTPDSDSTASSVPDLTYSAPSEDQSSQTDPTDNLEGGNSGPATSDPTSSIPSVSDPSENGTEGTEGSGPAGSTEDTDPTDPTQPQATEKPTIPTVPTEETKPKPSEPPATTPTQPPETQPEESTPPATEPEDDLEPGQYLITELIEENSLWECITDQSVVITVTAGQTTEVPFTNALRPGKISIHKVDTRGESLDSTEFTLEWSEDGINWQSVSYTDSTVPKIGGCTTAGLLEGGKLVTDETGLVSFEGLYPTLQYRLTETKAKNGYQLLQTYAYEGGLDVENELVVSLKVVNAEVFTMPETGGNTLIVQSWIVLALLCVSTLAVIQLMPQPKKKEK